jgi:hypothetical protein
VIETVRRIDKYTLYAVKAAKNVLLFFIAVTNTPDAIQNVRVHFPNQYGAVKEIVEDLGNYRYRHEYDDHPARDEYFRLEIVSQGEGAIPEPARPDDQNRKEWLIAASGLSPVITGQYFQG